MPLLFPGIATAASVTPPSLPPMIADSPSAVAPVAEIRSVSVIDSFPRAPFRAAHCICSGPGIFPGLGSGVGIAGPPDFDAGIAVLRLVLLLVPGDGLVAAGNGGGGCWGGFFDADLNSELGDNCCPNFNRCRWLVLKNRKGSVGSTGRLTGMREPDFLFRAVLVLNSDESGRRARFSLSVRRRLSLDRLCW